MSTREQRLAEFARVAVCLEQKEDFPAEVMIAQWAVESRWGAKPSGKYNFFGIKFVEGQHDTFSWVSTREEVDDEGLDYIRTLQHLGKVRNVQVVGKTERGRHIVSQEDRFADFSSPLDGARAYIRFLRDNGRYSAALAAYAKDRDPIKLIEGIAAAGYATGGGYATLVSQIAGQRNVHSAIKAAYAEGDPCAAKTP